MRLTILILVLISVTHLNAQQWLGANPIYYNSGNVGIGTGTPSMWFSSKVVEISHSRPVLKLTALGASDISTLAFTNANVNANHIGEFHVNYQFNQTNNEKSVLRFGSYPALDLMTLQSSGNIGMGTQSPSGLLHLYNPTNVNHWSANNYGANLVIDGTHHNSIAMLDAASSNPIAITNLVGRLMISKMPALGDVSSLPIALMSIGNDGSVGIGTGSSVPDAKLAVKGTIHSQEVKVDMQGSMVPDYVFETTYTLPSLDSVQSYINQNKHLPDVPSAKEIAANGVNLGEMNMLLLKKVEELTLYVISQQKQIEELKTIIKSK